MLKNKNGVFYRKWGTPDSKAAVLAVHGMGAHSERYKDMALFLNKKRISVYAIELRGYGELAGDKPGHVDSFKTYCGDIAGLKEIIKKENKGLPVFLLGESMGAVISHINILDYDADYAGLAESAPVYRDIMKISLLKRAAIALKAIIKPSEPVLMPFVSRELTRDPKVLEKLDSDPREHKYASAKLLLLMLFSQIRAVSRMSRIKTPVLLMAAGKDMLGDTGYTLKVFEKIKSPKTVKLYPDSYHALTIEKNRNEVFKDIYEWMEGIKQFKVQR